MAIDAVQSLQAQALRAVPQIEALRDGQIVDARVVNMLTEKVARLALLGQLLDVETAQILQPGATLSLKAQWEGEALRLVLQPADQPDAQQAQPTGSTPRPPGPEQATTPQRTVTSAAPQAEGRAALPQPGAPQPPASIVQGSVPTPSPALVLASTLARNLVTHATPEPVTTGVLNAVPPVAAPAPVLAPATTPSQPVQTVPLGQAPTTPAAMQAALVSALTEKAPPALPLIEKGDDLRIAFTQTLRQAADKQTSLAPVFANLAALTQQADAGQRPDLPKEVLGLARAIMGLRVDGDKPMTGQTIKDALAKTGVFLEATLAAGQPVSEETDLKAALGNLKAVLGDVPETPAKDRTAHDRPPVRGAQLHGQAPVPPSLTADIPTTEALRTLRDQADSGLARLTLTQAAALPDPRDPAAPPRPDQPQQFTVEIPIRYQGETSMAQMQVSRDPPEGQARQPGREEPRHWTVRFSMDCEPVGPVHASVRLLNNQVGIRLWAERAETARTFTTLAPVLEQAMAATSVKFDGLVIAEGRPTAPDDIIHAALNPRHMLDRRS